MKDNQCRAYKRTYKCPKDKCDGRHRRMSRFYLIQEIVEMLMKSDIPIEKGN
ncbi:MAG: hypothetical protein ACLR48_10280 [Ruminococcus sp.]